MLPARHVSYDAAPDVEPADVHIKGQQDPRLHVNCLSIKELHVTGHHLSYIAYLEAVLRMTACLRCLSL